MADKTIPELTEATTLTGTAVFPFDSGIQTFRVTATNLAKALAAVFLPGCADEERRLSDSRYR
jgi:hypothetical protein